MSAPRVLDLSSGVRSAETPKDLSRWHGKKEVLYDLYIRQRKTLEDVKSIMETEHGFPKTLKHSDYEHVLREEFKYRKNLSADDWRLSVGPRIARRKAHGKLSEVTLNGSKVSNVDRRIRRSLQGKRSHRRANANAVLPHGVVIRTPSPQPSTFVAPSTFGRNRTANEIERHQRYQSTMDYPTDSPFAASSELLSLLTGVMPLSDAGSGATMLSAQLLREGCPINKLLAILDKYYQRVLNPTDLRLFGPNATIGILGKMCFDFSNGLQYNTISSSDMDSILDWIGFSVDNASLKLFFSQKSLTILAVWEALISTVREQEHVAAFDVLLSAHLSITDQAPWNQTTGGWYCDFSSCVDLVPMRAVTLLKAYPCDQDELDQVLQSAVLDIGGPNTALVKQLISAGASLKHCRTSVDRLIRDFGRHGCEVDDLALVKSVLEAGAVVDELSRGDHLGWRNPDHPYLATDSLLLNEEYLTHNRRLLLLVYPYSDRQRTTVTVPGIFEAASGGREQLGSYLSSRSRPSDGQVIQQVLEIALSEASGRGYVDVVQSLVEFGVDPNVRMLPQFGDRRDHHNVWHPVIRAVNTGKLDTLRTLVRTSSINIVLLEEVGEQLDLCSLRSMESSKRYQILRVFSALNLPPASRNEILFRAIESPYCRLHGHDDPDFGLVSQLLELGLACLDRPEHLDGETAHIVVRAIKRGCGINALDFLAKRDVEVLSAPSATTIAALLDATLKRYRERHEILEFLVRRVEGLQSYIQENVSSLLSSFLENTQTSQLCNDPMDNDEKHWENECLVMVTAKWFLDLGAPLKDFVFAKIVRHANDSFMLKLIRNVADMDAVNDCDALQWSIYLGRLNLAVALIERGALINGRQLQNDEVSRTPLQEACEKSAPFGFIRFLVDKGANVNGPPASNGGRTELQAACANGAGLSCIRFLVEKGAAVNAPPRPQYGFTALQHAAKDGLMNVAGLLLDHGADVNALSGYCQSDYHTLHLRFMRALDLAAEHARLDMVQFLLAAGARSCEPGHTGFEGAIEIATRGGNFAIARLLEDHADSHSGDPLEAEERWLRANSHACLYDGRIQDVGWVDFVERKGEDIATFEKYLKEKSDS